ncbi:uncharacterized protein B0P05DRAFT_603794 [Gilbertella persicaria]|uniref:uncharacterized protein n=1 Tax=Gilbertella persicaria TaxID=101096 RepID=UPI00221E915D|nr:uncharacterized protein B0P05DRAFT_603794 [Gilbertella persicaria]KAI8080300.1 hypothetical protein B0P05DRAFT_603794 [Gilbertella persicaria]
MPRIGPSEASKKSFDFIIIGEAGDSTPDDLLDVRIPLFNSKLKNTSVDWKLKSTYQNNANDRDIGVPLGKLLGGSSAFNACIAHRCSPSDYDVWGAPEWTYETLKPYFRKAETFHDTNSVSQELHGTTGPFHISQTRTENGPIGTYFRAVCRKLGLPEYDDMTDLPCQIGVTGLQASIYQGERITTASTYITKEIEQQRSNLFVALGCKVTRVLLEDQRVTHVEYLANDVIYTVAVEREAILSAGAILSPLLLLSSGIGPQEELGSLGIDTLVHLPGVGKNLQNHWRVPLVHETKHADMSLHAGIFKHQKESLDRALQQKDGPLTQLWPDVVAYMKIPDAPDNSSSRENTPQIELFAGGLALCRELSHLKEVDCATLLMVLIAPFSRGSVRLSDDKSPLIDFGLLQDKRDLECLEKGLQLSMSIAKDPEYENNCVKQWIKYPEDEHDSRTLHQYIKENIDTLHHYAGTCKMGLKQDESAVVDHHLRVHGIQGLRVVDASFFPTVPAGQTCFPVIACAERASDLILQDNQIQF